MTLMEISLNCVETYKANRLRLNWADRQKPSNLFRAWPSCGLLWQTLSATALKIFRFITALHPPSAVEQGSGHLALSLRC